jgi:L-iditol 2-dehydrogenase
MKTAVLTAPRSFELREEPVPEPARGEVLLRVAHCGVCTSELDMWRGDAEVEFPRRPGHEVSGVVEAVGAEVDAFSAGDPVAAWVTEGGFSEYVTVGAAYCVAATGVPLHAALAEPLSCAVNAVELANVSLGDDVVVVGAGFMGSLVHLLVNLRGARRVIVADARADALERSRARGATLTVDVRAMSLVDAVRDLTDGRGADVTFEVTGYQGALSLLGGVTRMSGTIAIVGFHQGADRSIPLGQWNWMAFKIANAHFRDVDTIMHGMRVGMRLLTSRLLDLEGLVTHRFQLQEIDRAFRTACEKPSGFTKATVSMLD